MREPMVSRARRVMVCVVCVASLLIFLSGTVIAQDTWTISATEPEGVTNPWALFEDEYGPWDDSSSTAEAEAGENPEQVFVYYQVAGATLKGRSSSTEFAYDGLGCIHTTAGSSRITNIELILPDGATIRYLRLYYKDSSTTGAVQTFLTRYDPGSGTSDLVSATSSTSGAPGYGTVLSPALTEVVDNANYAYTLIGWPTAHDANLQVCGMRVAYYAP